MNWRVVPAGRRCPCLAVFLIALWVRSSGWEDILTLPGDSAQRIGSTNGWITIRWWEVRPFPRRSTQGQLVSLSRKEVEEMELRHQPAGHYIGPTYSFRLIDSGAIQFHLWLPILGLAIATVAPWMRFHLRFSLRTLLIATMLVAVGLGLIVWSGLHASELTTHH